MGIRMSGLIPPQTIPTDEAHAIFTAIRTAAFDKKLYEGIDPEEGWHRHRVAPETVIAAAPGVTLDPNWTLVAYLFYERQNAWGACFAVRNEDADAEPEIDENNRLVPPACSAPSITVALRPSGDATSFFARSLVLRELNALGALWHGVSWGAHELIAGAADLPTARDMDAPWKWEGPAPASVNPVVEMTGGAARVTFCTRMGFRGSRIIEHTDIHSLRDGSIHSEERVIATARGGWIM